MGYIDGQDGAAASWHHLAKVYQDSGRSEAAETWYRKVLKAIGNGPLMSAAIHSLADLLQHQPDGLAVARQLAEEAMAIKQTLDPGAAMIWTTYNTLAKTADRQSRPEEAAEYRRLAREAMRTFPGTAREVKRFATIADTVVRAVAGTPEAIAVTEDLLRQSDKAGVGLH